MQHRFQRLHYLEVLPGRSHRDPHERPQQLPGERAHDHATVKHGFGKTAPARPVWVPRADQNKVRLTCHHAHPEPGQLQKAAKAAIETKLAAGEIRPHLGLGFGIVSPGYFSVSTWGGVDPTAINPHVFTYPEKRSFIDVPHRELGPAYSSSVGAYRVWEIAVAAHETAGWRQVLFANGDPVGAMRAREEYIKDFFEGRVDREITLAD